MTQKRSTRPTIPTMAQRIAGGLLGTLVGDAVGVPYEFKEPTALPPLHAIDMVPPAGYHRTYPDVPIGSWSDDGAQALCLVDSLLSCDGWDRQDFAACLISWRDTGYLAVDGWVFDCGIQTSGAIDALRAGRRVATPRGASASRGNGAVMRVIPVALYMVGQDTEDIARVAAESARVTHPGAVATGCAAFTALWAHEALIYPDSSLFSAYTQAWGILGVLNTHGQYTHALKWLDPDREHIVRGTGEVVDCVRSALWAVMDARDFQDAIQRAISLGHDTDTTAAVAGGIAGIKWGVDAIPQAWRDLMREPDIIAEAGHALLSHLGLTK